MGKENGILKWRGLPERDVGKVDICSLLSFIFLSSSAVERSAVKLLVVGSGLVVVGSGLVSRHSSSSRLSSLDVGFSKSLALEE